MEHRLTVAFPTGLRTAEAVSGSTFTAVTHQAPFAQKSCRDLVTAAAGGRRLTILSRAMHAFDGYGERGRLVLGKCLLKANGWVNHGLVPHWSAPEGNCLRPVVQEYAILPGRAADPFADLAAAAAEFNHAPYTDHCLDKVGGGLPGVLSLVSVASPYELSACKRAEDRQGLIVRAVNMSDHPAVLAITTAAALRIRSAWRTDLCERRQAGVPVMAGRVTVRGRPWEIITVELA